MDKNYPEFKEEDSAQKKMEVIRIKNSIRRILHHI